MSTMASNVQEKLKNSSNSILLLVYKVFTGLVLGLTLSLIGQEIFAYSTFLFIFVILVIMGLFLKKAKRWSWIAISVFNLVCVLVGLLLRMYILIAPGA